MSRNEHWRKMFGRTSEGGLRGLHDALRGALAEDDQLPKGAKKYGVREYADFREQSDLMEEVMRERDIDFTPISW